MILLILFYLAVVIAAGLLIAFGFSFYLRSRQISAPEDQNYLAHPQNFRPLFAPSEEDIRALESAEKEAEKQRARENEHENERQALLEKSGLANEFKRIWLNAPDRRGAAELLRLAGESENAETFSEIAENVIQVWHDEKIAGLKAAELAALLDSHFRLLPQQEMASGALFWLKQEIAELRLKAEN
jgi:hypothetical protein